MRTYIEASQVLDGTGTHYTDGAVLVEDNKIQQVGPSEDVNAEAADETLILGDQTVLPGLIDTHTHISNDGAVDRTRYLLLSSPAERTADTIKHARDTINAGVTTIRDVGSPMDIPMVVREKITAGDFVGPRILTAGRGITATGGHGKDGIPWDLADVDAVDAGRKGRIANGVPEIKRAVREQLQKEADLIKVWATGGIIDPEEQAMTMEFSQEELNAIVAEADRHNVPVASHAHNPRGIIASVEAGVDTIEHGMYMDEESIEAMAENDVTLVSTLSIMKKLSMSDDVPPHYHKNAARALEHHESMLLEARKSGVPLAMGTDAGSSTYPHGENAFELQCYVEAGLDPVDVIQISTSESAAAIGLGDTTGTLAESYAADVIAVDGDPTSDIGILCDPANVGFVMANGKIVKNLYT